VVEEPVFELSNILNSPVYGLGHEQKDALFSEGLGELTRKHYTGCPEYKKILDLMGFDPHRPARPEDFPFLPVRLFKEYDLLSVPRTEIVKTMTSSGTTGQRVSRIFLDRQTSTNQTKVLAKIVSTLLGAQRLPMLIIDSRSVMRDRSLFSARAAGILGFSMLGRDHVYALSEDMEPNMQVVAAFVERHQAEPIMVFGFTFIIWKHFLTWLKQRGMRLHMPEGVIIHGGGWKKLTQEAVDSDAFRRRAEEVCGVRRVYNYYGMVEQTGSIFMECEEGRLHAPVFSDVIIRELRDFRPMEPGGQGLIQLMSLLPGSYPGHSILSEDLGEIVGVDDCPCGRMGKSFRVHGRIQEAEARGCSDVYAAGTG